MHPILVDFGFYALPSYGVLLAIGVLVALWAAKKRADSVGMNGIRVVDLALWMVIWALIGSKVLLVIIDFRRYLKNPADLLGVIRAGGVFLGGFLAAMVAGAFLLRRYKLACLPTLDVLAPSLSLGQAIVAASIGER